jgi:hypothetical protein
MENHARAHGPRQPDDTRIAWHPAFVEAIQLVLGKYRDALEFLPEFQLAEEPLRIDVVIIKKTKDVAIDNIIAAAFKSANLVEYKSPTDHISVEDFYKVYAYACLYASSPKGVPITDLTITFVGSRYPRSLLSHLKKVWGYTVEERSPGIYTVKGNIIPIQVINSRRLAGAENTWLKDLDNKLDAGQVDRILAKLEGLGKAARVGAYLDVISRANAKVMEEVKAMGRNRIPTFEEVWASTGLVEKYRAEGAAEVRKEAETQIQAAQREREKAEQRAAELERRLREAGL